VKKWYLRRIARAVPCIRLNSVGSKFVSRCGDLEGGGTDSAATTALEMGRLAVSLFLVYLLTVRAEAAICGGDGVSCTSPVLILARRNIDVRVFVQIHRLSLHLLSSRIFEVFTRLIQWPPLFLFFRFPPRARRRRPPHQHQS
jgi:hypothetical protein